MLKRSFLCLIFLGGLGIACQRTGTSSAKAVPLAAGADGPAASAPKSEPPLADQAKALALEIRESRTTMASSFSTQIDAREKNVRRKTRSHNRFERALKKVYAGTDSAPYFFENRELIPHTLSSLLTFIDALPAHAIDPTPYRKEEILKSFRTFEDKREKENKANAALEGLVQGTERLRFLQSMLTLSSDVPAELEEALVSRGLVDEDLPTLKALVAAIETISEARNETDSAAIDLDLDLIRATMQTVLDFRLVKRAHPFLVLTYPERSPDYFADTLAKRFHPEKDSDVTTDPEPKTKPDPSEPKGIEPRTDLAGFLTDQFPPTPLYHRSVEAFQHYQNLAEQSATNTPPSIGRNATRLRTGSRGAPVPALRERLMFEGYLPQDHLITPLFDSTLQTALRAYQTTHQIDVNGIVDNLTRSSLNRSMKYRAKQLKLGLQRYRESQINADRPEIYLRVNVPEFSVELWRNGTLVKKHKVVVGNNNWEEDHRRKIVGYLNRTQLFKATITSIVLNPFWRVPKRIKVFELDEALLDNPDFYERNRYEVDTSPKGDESVRQMPGEGNALGRVKINFPNPHAIFMHDTPQKPLFEKIFRAYSHGCMRLHNPLEMAEHLLQQDHDIAPERFKEILDSFEETSIALKTHIPIYVEYNVTTVDENGKAHFLSDIYKYDKSFYTAELPAVNEFELEAFKEGEMVPFEGVARKRQP